VDRADGAKVRVEGKSFSVEEKGRRGKKRLARNGLQSQPLMNQSAMSASALQAQTGGAGWIGEDEYRISIQRGSNLYGRGARPYKAKIKRKRTKGGNSKIPGSGGIVFKASTGKKRGNLLP